MDGAGLSWAYYASSVYGDGGIWSAYQNISPIYNGPDWSKDIISPQTNFFTDVSNGKLRDLTWITPTCENSDHAGCGSKTGPSWVASLVNAIGESQYWDNTAIFIFWDDYGGWYDPVAPQMLDYDGLGMRIPMLIVSAYAKKGYVSHMPLRARQHFEVCRGYLRVCAVSGQRYGRATPPDDAFDFNKPARKFERSRRSTGSTTSCTKRPTIASRTPSKDHASASHRYPARVAAGRGRRAFAFGLQR